MCAATESFDKRKRKVPASSSSSRFVPIHTPRARDRSIPIIYPCHSSPAFLPSTLPFHSSVPLPPLFRTTPSTPVFRTTPSAPLHSTPHRPTLLASPRSAFHASSPPLPPQLKRLHPSDHHPNPLNSSSQPSATLSIGIPALKQSAKRHTPQFNPLNHLYSSA